MQTNLTININGPNERQNTDTTTVPSMIILLNENVLQENLPSENIHTVLYIQSNLSYVTFLRNSEIWSHDMKYTVKGNRN